MKMSRMPALANPPMMCSRIGLPCTLSIGLGNSSVSPRMRVPLPAARITAFIFTVVAVTVPNVEVKSRHQWESWHELISRIASRLVSPSRIPLALFRGHGSVRLVSQLAPRHEVLESNFNQVHVE